MKTLYTLFIATLIMSATLLIIPSHIYAGRCDFENIYNSNPQIFRLSSNVFVGTVTSINNHTGQNGNFAVQFSIEKLWKGTSDQKSLKVVTGELEGCGYSITTGAKYLVYTIGFPPFLQGPWTKPYADAQSDIALLNDPNFQAQEKTKEELNKMLHAAENKLLPVMVNRTSDIPFNMLSVDELNSTLIVGIDSTKATLSKEEYQKKIKDIVGDIPMKIEIMEITPTGGSSINNVSRNDTLSSLPTLPLKQFKSGILFNDIQCKQGLVLITKTSDNSPACVKPQTASKLVERGWGEITSINKINPKSTCEASGGQWDEKYRECVGVSSQTCKALNGTYNQCDSACRHLNTGGCIAVCVQVCSVK